MNNRIKPKEKVKKIRDKSIVERIKKYLLVGLSLIFIFSIQIAIIEFCEFYISEKYPSFWSDIKGTGTFKEGFFTGDLEDKSGDIEYRDLPVFALFTFLTGMNLILIKFIIKLVQIFL